MALIFVHFILLDYIWLSVVIKNPMALLVKSRGVTPVSWPNAHHWPLSIMAS